MTIPATSVSGPVKGRVDPVTGGTVVTVDPVMMLVLVESRGTVVEVLISGGIVDVVGGRVLVVLSVGTVVEVVDAGIVVDVLAEGIVVVLVEGAVVVVDEGGAVVDVEVVVVIACSIVHVAVTS